MLLERKRNGLSRERVGGLSSAYLVRTDWSPLGPLVVGRTAQRFRPCTNVQILPALRQNAGVGMTPAFIHQFSAPALLPSQCADGGSTLSRAAADWIAPLNTEQRTSNVQSETFRAVPVCGQVDHFTHGEGNTRA